MRPEQAKDYSEWWAGGVERIAAAFNNLASNPDERLPEGSPLRNEWGRYFMQMYRGPDTRERTNYRKRQAPASRRTTKSELARALKALHELIASLEEMHRPSVEAIGGRNDHENFLYQLSDLKISLANPEIPETLDGDGKGRPANPYPLEVAIEVGRIYRHVTGRHPTITKDWGGGKARGPFLAVLAEVFDVLGISASPESRGASAIKAIERMPETTAR